MTLTKQAHRAQGGCDSQLQQSLPKRLRDFLRTGRSMKRLDLMLPQLPQETEPRLDMRRRFVFRVARFESRASYGVHQPQPVLFVTGNPKGKSVLLRALAHFECGFHEAFVNFARVGVRTFPISNSLHDAFTLREQNAKHLLHCIKKNVGTVAFDGADAMDLAADNVKIPRSDLPIPICVLFRTERWPIRTP